MPQLSCIHAVTEMAKRDRAIVIKWKDVWTSVISGSAPQASKMQALNWMQQRSQKAKSVKAGTEDAFKKEGEPPRIPKTNPP